MTLAESCSLGKRNKKRRCHPCHGSRRSLKSWFVKMGRSNEWGNMNPENKRQLVKEHGRKRQINVEESAACQDKLKLGNHANFLTKKQPLWTQSVSVGFFISKHQ